MRPRVRVTPASMCGAALSFLLCVGLGIFAYCERQTQLREARNWDLRLNEVMARVSASAAFTDAALAQRRAETEHLKRPGSDQTTWKALRARLSLPWTVEREPMDRAGGRSTPDVELTLAGLPLTKWPEVVNDIVLIEANWGGFIDRFSANSSEGKRSDTFTALSVALGSH